MFCNGMCGICHRCKNGRVVPIEKFTPNEETVKEEELPVSASYELSTNVFGKTKVRRLK